MTKQVKITPDASQRPKGRAAYSSKIIAPLKWKPIKTLALRKSVSYWRKMLSLVEIKKVITISVVLGDHQDANHPIKKLPRNRQEIRVSLKKKKVQELLKLAEYYAQEMGISDLTPITLGKPLCKEHQKAVQTFVEKQLAAWKQEGQSQRLAEASVNKREQQQLASVDQVMKKLDETTEAIQNSKASRSPELQQQYMVAFHAKRAALLDNPLLQKRAAARLAGLKHFFDRANRKRRQPDVATKSHGDTNRSRQQP